MLAAVYFLSLYQAQKIPGRQDTIVVSIRDRHDTPQLQSGFRDVLPLYFDDHDEVRDGADAKAGRFDGEHTRSLRSWLAPYTVSSESLIYMVHCQAGISRSAAIAWWVHQEFGVPLRTSFPVHYLNRHVLHVLNPTIAPPAVSESRQTLAATVFERVFDDDVWPDLPAPDAQGR